jgi:hypothetical protein
LFSFVFCIVCLVMCGFCVVCLVLLFVFLGLLWTEGVEVGILQQIKLLQSFLTVVGSPGGVAEFVSPW